MRKVVINNRLEEYRNRIDSVNRLLGTGDVCCSMAIGLMCVEQDSVLVQPCERILHCLRVYECEYPLTRSCSHNLVLAHWFRLCILLSCVYSLDETRGRLESAYLARCLFSIQQTGLIYQQRKNR